MGGPSLGAVKRLKKDYQKLLKDPVPYALAAPLQSNILEWHYVIFGAPETPYEGKGFHTVVWILDWYTVVSVV